jgi:hypothetical protein
MLRLRPKGAPRWRQGRLPPRYLSNRAALNRRTKSYKTLSRSFRARRVHIAPGLSGVRLSGLEDPASTDLRNKAGSLER